MLRCVGGMAAGNLAVIIDATAGRKLALREAPRHRGEAHRRQAPISISSHYSLRVAEMYPRNTVCASFSYGGVRGTHRLFA